MRNILNILGLLAALLTLGTSWSCVKGKGEVVTRELAVAPFGTINLQGAMDVRITRSAAQRVTVEAQSNLVDLVETTVKDGAWTIRTSTCYSSDKPFIVHVAVPSLEAITLQGSGNITGMDEFGTDELVLVLQGSGELTMGVKARTVKASVQGSGDMKLAGSCELFTASVQGSGDIKAGNLQAASGDVTIQGSGDISVNVTGELTARIAGSGDVKYRTEPTSIDARITGSGTVREAK